MAERNGANHCPQAVMESGRDAKTGERRAVQKFVALLTIFARVFVGF
jgi:hypothetical protein